MIIKNNNNLVLLFPSDQDKGVTATITTTTAII